MRQDKEQQEWRTKKGLISHVKWTALHDDIVAGDATATLSRRIKLVKSVSIMRQRQSHGHVMWMAEEGEILEKEWGACCNINYTGINGKEKGSEEESRIKLVTFIRVKVFMLLKRKFGEINGFWERWPWCCRRPKDVQSNNRLLIAIIRDSAPLYPFFAENLMIKLTVVIHCLVRNVWRVLLWTTHLLPFIQGALWHWIAPITHDGNCECETSSSVRHQHSPNLCGNCNLVVA